MIAYFIKVNVLWIILYGIYHFALRRETFFSINRLYLLMSLLAGILLPYYYQYINWQTTYNLNATYFIEPIIIGVENMQYTLDEIVITPEVSNNWSWSIALKSIYSIGVLIIATQFCYGLQMVWSIRQKSTIIKKKGYNLVRTSKKHLPFSFFKDLYWSKTLKMQEKEAADILKHELTHIQQLHSLDIIFIKLLTILFWFNPVLWLYQNSIKNIHEYLADASVLQQSKKKQYGQLLLKQVQSGVAFSFTNNLNHSQLKKRFQMMNQTKSSKWALYKYLWIVPVLVITTMAFSLKNANSTTMTNTTDPGDKIYKIVDEMPSFEGCSNDLTKEAKAACSNKNMLTYIYSNIKYPQEVREKNIEGVTVVRFVVEKDGSVTNSEIIKSIHPSIDAEVFKIVDNMPNWDPGKHKGEKVRVYINLPIKFKMMDDTPEESPSSSDDIFTTVDQMPMFKGCEDIEDKEEQANCANKNMLMYVYSNLKYPEEARKKGIQGAVITKFIVEKDGSITNPSIVKSIGGGCDEAVLEIINNMPKWNPGIHQGKNVSVYFHLPIKFQISDEGNTSETNEKKQIHGEKAAKMTISPNPNNGQTTISIEGKSAEATISIAGMDGRVYKTFQLKNIDGKEEINVNLKALGITKKAIVVIKQGAFQDVQQVIIE